MEKSKSKGNGPDLTPDEEEVLFYIDDWIRIFTATPSSRMIANQLDMTIDKVEVLRKSIGEKLKMPLDYL